MQRAVNHLAGVHRHLAVIALPAAVHQRQIAQADIQIGCRPAWPFKPRVGHVNAAKRKRGERRQRLQQIAYRFRGLQTDIA